MIEQHLVWSLPLSPGALSEAGSEHLERQLGLSFHGRRSPDEETIAHRFIRDERQAAVILRVARRGDLFIELVAYGDIQIEEAAAATLLRDAGRVSEEASRASAPSPPSQLDPVEPPDRRTTHMSNFGFAAEEEFPTFPVIFLVDRSASMTNVIDDVTIGVNKFISHLATDPATREIVALAVVEFNHQARLKRPLRWLDQDVQPTRVAFSTDGRTNFEKPLRMAYDLLSENLPKLSRQGWRPAIFFASDGNPNEGDDWQGARRRLLEMSFGPRTRRGVNIATLGVGDQNEPLLKQLASKPDLHLQFAQDAQGIADLIQTMLSTVVGYAGGRTATPGLADAMLADDRGDDVRTVTFGDE